MPVTDARTSARGSRSASLPSPQAVADGLREASYLADHGTATAVFLALKMQRPLLLEGPAGVGKTEIAKALSRMLGRRLIRLQCYEGLDAGHALYDWDYPRQLLRAQVTGGAHHRDLGADVERELYSERFLLERPLLAAVRAGSDAVLLIDELDRADDEFEAFLLEFLGEFTVTVPELGTIAAASPPTVVITSNRTRELHDALKRRCLFHWIDFPSHDREVEIIKLRAPGVSDRLADDVAAAVRRLRAMDLVKQPGAAESVDWAQALAILGADTITEPLAGESLGWVVKTRDDLERVRAALPEVLDA